MDLISLIVGAAAGLIVGAILIWLILNSALKGRKNSIISEAEKEAEAIKKDKMLQAKEKFLQLKEEHELTKKLEEISRSEKENNQLKERLSAQLEKSNAKLEELEKTHRKQVEELEKISGYSRDEAKNQLVEALKAEAKTEAMSYIKDTMEEAKINANKEAKKIVIQSIQRVATETAVENAVSVFNIENDELKGRIIGREGRNIRALEAATGVEIIVDDTPEAIILSCFDSVRREIARLALHQLVSDGRIHPARIEEVVAKTKQRLEEEIIETGKRTCIDLGIHGLHPELMRMVGRMKYRSSYGQNLLQHSREVANLCAIMAGELG